MKEIKGKLITIKVPLDLAKRVEKQRKKENRTLSEFVRRVLDRYLVEQEVRGDTLSPETRESIRKNKELLRLLRNS